MPSIVITLDVGEFVTLVFVLLAFGGLLGYALRGKRHE